MNTTGSSFALALMLAPCTASAADPACINPTPASTSTTQDWSTGVRLCAPTLDSAGVALEADEITNCFVLVNGGLVASAPASPGALLVFFPEPVWPKRGDVTANCVGSAGASPFTPTYLNARLRKGAPGKPALLP